MRCCRRSASVRASPCRARSPAWASTTACGSSTLDGRHPPRTRCVLIATGVSYRRLDVPRFRDFEGAGVYYAATEMEARLCRGEEVVVVGAGNSAGQAIVYLSRYARQRPRRRARRRSRQEHVALPRRSRRAHRERHHPPRRRRSARSKATATWAPSGSATAIRRERRGHAAPCSCSSAPMRTPAG